MVMQQIAILHGWSDTSDSFRNLQEFLVRNGFESADIRLGDYITLQDDIRIEDVADRMQDVIQQQIASGILKAPFDLIVHSTGGLVAREWISRFYPQGLGCPVKRLIMLAPANFGSRLASTGKSMLGRIVKGWNNWFEVGKVMLDELELASSYSWDLASRDLLDPAADNLPGPYGFGKVMPFILVGTRGYRTGPRRIVDEPGADGTVRCAAANLNVIGMTIDFSTNNEQPRITPWRQRNLGLEFPFAILPDRNHSTICDPDADPGLKNIEDLLGDCILNALKCDGAQDYERLASSWNLISESTSQLGGQPEKVAALFGTDPLDDADANSLHQYFQVVIAVKDSLGRQVTDYFVEFFSPDVGGTSDFELFHTEVLDDVHVNQLNASLRCLFIDRTDLEEKFYKLRPKIKNLAMSLSASNPGPNVRYFSTQAVGARGQLIIHKEDMTAAEDLGGARLRRNRTHLVEIIIPRRPMDDVFKLSQGV
jgi:pimeloyl-ACP methyl ester carboxylesterase